MILLLRVFILCCCCFRSVLVYCSPYIRSSKGLNCGFVRFVIVVSVGVPWALFDSTEISDSTWFSKSSNMYIFVHSFIDNFLFCLLSPGWAVSSKYDFDVVFSRFDHWIWKYWNPSMFWLLPIFKCFREKGEFNFNRGIILFTKKIDIVEVTLNYIYVN